VVQQKNRQRRVRVEVYKSSFSTQSCSTSSISISFPQNSRHRFPLKPIHKHKPQNSNASTPSPPQNAFSHYRLPPPPRRPRPPPKPHSRRPSCSCSPDTADLATRGCYYNTFPDQQSCTASCSGATNVGGALYAGVCLANPNGVRIGIVPPLELVTCSHVFSPQLPFNQTCKLSSPNKRFLDL